MNQQLKTRAPFGPDHAFVSDEKVQAVRRRLVEAGVRYCVASWVDIDGRSKGKFVPVERFGELAHGSEKYTAQGFEVMGPLGPQDDDQAALPDLDSIVICPWDKRIAWMAGDLHYQGEAYPYCSRSILKAAVAKGKAQGYAMMLGIEPEFYVLRDLGSGRSAPFHPADAGPVWGYDVEKTLDAMPILDVLERYLDELGWEVSAFEHEAGHSQYEFDCGFTDVVTMCDRFVFLRLMLKEVAKSFGAFVTFMPKPFANDFRSGAHMNMSLVDARTGENLMMDPHDPRGIGMSATSYRFVGGLLKHASSLTAVSCPTVNGYKGFVPAGVAEEGVARDWSWAPTYAAYGYNNRALMLRVPNGRQCIENRVPDSSMNPYWAAAMHLGAGLEGVTQGLDPGEPLNENVYQQSRSRLLEGGTKPLPSNLSEALDAFEHDPLTDQVLGSGPKREYLQLKRLEWGRYNRHVSDWELENYLHRY